MFRDAVWHARMTKQARGRRCPHRLREVIGSHCGRRFAPRPCPERPSRVESIRGPSVRQARCRGRPALRAYSRRRASRGSWRSLRERQRLIPLRWGWPAGSHSAMRVTRCASKGRFSALRRSPRSHSPAARDQARPARYAWVGSVAASTPYVPLRCPG